MHDRLSQEPSADSVVARVLGEIARDVTQCSIPGLGLLNPALARILLEAAATVDPAPFRTAVAEVRSAGVSAATLAEVYVPHVARQLGEGWVDDRLDFRSVSVGAARLQSLLWQLGPEWAQTGVLVSNSRAPVLVAVPQGCQHTLGATVLAGQLRYRGISVQLDLEFTGTSTPGAAQKHYTALFLSASARERLEHLAVVVQKARQTYPGTPIVIGGNVTAQSADIQISTEADLVTSHLEEALAFCGLGAVMSRQGDARQAGAGA